MSGLPIESGFSNQPQRPVSDQDRAVLTDRLNQAFENGDIDIDRYRELMDQIYAATTGGELVPVAHELPGKYRSTAPQGAESGVELAPGEVNQPAKRPDFSSPALRYTGIGIGVAVGIVMLLVFLAYLL